MYAYTSVHTCLFEDFPAPVCTLTAQYIKKGNTGWVEGSFGRGMGADSSPTCAGPTPTFREFLEKWILFVRVNQSRSLAGLPDLDFDIVCIYFLLMRHAEEMRFWSRRDNSDREGEGVGRRVGFFV